MIPGRDPGRDDDRTVIVPRNRSASGAPKWIALGALVVLAGALLGGGAWWVFGSARAPSAQPPLSTSEPAQPIVAIIAPPRPLVQSAPLIPVVSDIRIADEAGILANDPQAINVFRFAPNPAIVVLDFPTLAQQGRMLNRLAVFVEKAGAPHDRVLDDAALDAAIRSGGDVPDTYYYGHDYRASDIARFFRLAEEERITLTKDELWLRGLAGQFGWLALESRNGEEALISIPRAGADSFADRRVRAVILHHELSHGEYFTNPVYAAYTRNFWTSVLSAGDRKDFRSFLARERYDSSLEDLMMNEAQAYLMHTRDARFFSPEVLGLPQRRVDQLQARFLLDMPPGWLRDCTSLPGQPAAPVAAVISPAIPARAPRRSLYGLGAISRRKAVAATLVPRRRAASNAA